MIRFVQIGLGPLGQRIVRGALARPSFRLVAAVDADPAKAGRDVGELCGLRRLGVRVRPAIAAASGVRADAVILATVSGMEAIAPQIEAAARLGLPIVSTCEELSFPWRTAPRLAARIDRACRRAGVACLGTGVNPGFLMDYLPCVLTSVCQEVRRVRVSRFQDASIRRVPFQRKIGAGLARAEFRQKAKAGTLRHVGLTESMHMIAHNLGWTLDRTAESLRPVIAKKRIASGYVPIPVGRAAGVEQIGRAFRGGREVIRLHFLAAVGEPNPRDEIEIDGEPSFRSVIPGGMHGDTATCAIALNAVRSVARMPPGLHTMLDIPAPGCCAAQTRGRRESS